MTLPTTGPTAQVNPDAFVGRVTLSAYEPYPSVTATGYSSNAPASLAVIHWHQPQPLIVKNIYVQNSLAAGVPAATSQASSGTDGYSYAYSAFLFSRQDYGANSTNISHLNSASFGLTATLSYTSTGQSFGMSWVTDTTGGLATFSTASADGGWSNYANGPRNLSIPFVTTMTAGEYWLAFQHSSTAATTNSAVTILSASQFMILGQQGNATAGSLGQSTTNANQWIFGPQNNAGQFTAITTNTTMALMGNLGLNARPVWFALSNA